MHRGDIVICQGTKATSVKDGGNTMRGYDVLCNLGTYHVMGEDKLALYYVDAPNQETLLAAGFDEVHYRLKY